MIDTSVTIDAEQALAIINKAESWVASSITVLSHLIEGGDRDFTNKRSRHMLEVRQAQLDLLNEAADLWSSHAASPSNGLYANRIERAALRLAEVLSRECEL